MVFSQTSLETRNLLKVVEIDRLKSNKNQQANGGLTGVMARGNSETTPFSPAPTTSFSEVRKGPAAEYLKPEPLFENTMFPESDYEFFQDLGWSCVPARAEQVQTTDMAVKKTEERANTFDTTNTLSSPQGWDAKSPLAQASFYGTSTPKDSLSPTAVDGFSKFDEFLYPQEFSKIEAPEQFQNILDLPVVLGDSENYGVDNMWPVVNSVDWPYTHTTQYSKHPNTTHSTPFIHQEDSLNQDDLKFVSVMPRDIENNNVVISEFILDQRGKGGVLQEAGVRTQPVGLSVDLMAASASSGPNISTPDVVNYVVQLEKEKSTFFDMVPPKEGPEEVGVATYETCLIKASPSPAEYEPSTPRDESYIDSEGEDSQEIRSHSGRRKRRISEDSDETYTPPARKPRRKIRSNIKEIKDIINSQKPPRRGRPPKERRESTFSSVGSVDDNASNLSTQELKYRELRDKNNEASKRSRMNRKLKELQMEQQADELEEQNKKLRVRASVLEEMTIKLKNALMMAMTQK